jgi:predicted glycosyltransferase
MVMPAEHVRPGSMRVMAYCHDGVGIGHLRRTLSICERVGRALPGTSFLVATGTPYVPLFENLPGVDYIKLPALSKVSNGVYRGKSLGLPSDQILQCRAALLSKTAQYFQPDVLLVDKAPLGVCGELLKTIEGLRAHRPSTRIVYGMRDIEDEPQSVMAQWETSAIPQALSAHFDEIWVYGMQSVFDPATEYQLPHEVRGKMTYMGYLGRRICRHPAPRQQRDDEVLVTVGGGTDGLPVLETYLASAAARVGEAGYRSVLIGGPDLPPKDALRLRSRARLMRHVSWKDFEPCMSCRMRRARLVVCMGGYNTLCELASQRKPALVIPRTHPRQEQSMRAALWARQSAVSTLCRQSLSPDALADRVMQLLEQGPRSTSPRLDLDGLDRVADRFQAFSREERADAAAVRLH